MVVVDSSETRVILLSLALGGCHVFEVVEIECAAGELCARGRGRDTDGDADTDADTDTDTDSDTGPVVNPTRGWVLSGISSAGSGAVFAFDPTGAVLAQWSDLWAVAGPVAFDPASDSAFLAYDSALYQLKSDGEQKRALIAFPDVLSLAAADGVVYMATGNGLTSWSSTDEVVTTATFDPAVTGLVGVGVGVGGAVYATDTNSGAPDLYEWSAGGAPTVVAADFDGSAARARIVFAGPDGVAYTCSAAGAFYAVADLVAGSSRPVAVYSGGLTDVSACAYDPGDATWLLFSPTAGVIRLDAQNRAETVFAPDSSTTLVRGGFF
jgi:hypothetical protein